MKIKNPSDKDLKEEIEKILENADLTKTSSKKVRQQLEENFGVSLGTKKKVIDEMVMKYVNQKQDDDDDDEAEDKGDEEEDGDSSDDEEVIVKPTPKKGKPTKKRKESSEEDDEVDEPPPKRKPAKKKAASTEEEDEEDSEESEYDEEVTKKKKKKAAGKAKGKKAGGVDGRGKNSGYTRAYKLSPALADLLGEDEMPRHEVVKRVWAIIKERKLYDPNNKQFAICDDALYKVIGTKRFRCFGMMKYLKSHFIMS